MDTFIESLRLKLYNPEPIIKCLNVILQFIYFSKTDSLSIWFYTFVKHNSSILHVVNFDFISLKDEKINNYKRTT